MISFGLEFMELIQIYENIETVPYSDRIKIYEKLLLSITSDQHLESCLYNNVIESLKSFYQKLIQLDNHLLISRFEYTFDRWMKMTSNIFYVDITSEKNLRNKA